MESNLPITKNKINVEKRILKNSRIKNNIKLPQNINEFNTFMSIGR